jgi:acyl-CoA synthetase (AMP-forming)/AMP-acid ligase II
MQIEAVIVDSSTITTLLEAAAPARVFSLGPCLRAIDLFDLATAGPALDPSVQPDAIALLCFTSGSTGQPKGCAMTYGALSQHWSWHTPERWSPVAQELAHAFQRYLLFGTLASLVVFEFLAPCLLGGGTAVIPEADAGPLFPQAIERYRITGSIITVPRLCGMLDRLRDEPVDVSSLRGLMVSGSPLSPSRLASAVERLGPVIYQGYGQTEAGSISMLMPADIVRSPERVLSSVGRPHPSVMLSVRNEAGQPMGPGQVGEIYVKSPYLMAGYWDQPDETAATLEAGWLRTRDLGQLDDAGFLHLVGRTRDVIMVNALVVYAGPIEQVLARHPSVDQAYVAGAPDEQTGEAIHAFVVLKSGLALEPEALRTLVRAELGNDSVPRTITRVDHVPVAVSGKPDKRALLELLPE